MTNTRAVSDGRVELDAIVAPLNVERFSKLFAEEVDEARRQTLVHLIAEEKVKLDALAASPDIA
jgi:hypothetical protein